MKQAIINLDQVCELVMSEIKKAEALPETNRRRLILLDRATTVNEFLARLGINVEVQKDAGGNIYCVKAYQVAIKYPSEVQHGQ